MALGFLLVQSGFVGALVLVLPAIFFYYGFVKNWRVKISTAMFYGDYFEIYGRGLCESFQYEDIEKVEIAGRTSLGTPVSHLTIGLKQRRGPILLIMNPRSKSLRIDLYSWLINRLSN
jgi:hypothetical protein